jgi:hypothetical protein
MVKEGSANSRPTGCKSQSCLYQLVPEFYTPVTREWPVQAPPPHRPRPCEVRKDDARERGDNLAKGSL